MAGLSVPQWLTDWVDARIANGVKVAIAQVDAQAEADATQLFTDLGDDLKASIPAAVGALITEAKGDVLGGVTAIPGAVNTALGQGVLSVEQLGQIMAQAFNPQQLSQAIAQSLKQMTGGLLETRPTEPWHGKTHPGEVTDP